MGRGHPPPSQFRLPACLVLLVNPLLDDAEAGRWGGPGVLPLNTPPHKPLLHLPNAIRLNSC